MIEFQGRKYFDDRIFILYLSRGKVDTDSNGLISTTIC